MAEVLWDSPQAEVLRRIRFKVFVDEQKVPADLEIDAVDRIATHVLATLGDGTDVGTGRLFPDPEEPGAGRIGRMAVLPEARSLGVGSAILRNLMRRAVDAGYHRLVLDAQVAAIPFYQRHGFQVVGPEHWDAGILHRQMAMTAKEAAALLTSSAP